MVMQSRMLFLSLGVGAVFTAALALSGASAQESGRFRMEGTDTGYVRLDTQTGAISLCNEQNGQMICKMATEDREAYEHDISALEKRVAELEARVQGLEKGAPAAKSGLPSEEEFEQSMSYMERFLKRFMSIAKSFDSEPEKPEPQAVPGRT